MLMTYCHKCHQSKPDAEVIASVCLGCRAEANEDERPVVHLVSGLMFPAAKPKSNPRKLEYRDIAQLDDV